MYATTMYKSAAELNSAMAGVYRNMMLAIVTSMITSYVVSSNPMLMALLFGTALKWVVIFAPVIMAAVVGYNIYHVSRPMAHVLLHSFAALMGLGMSTIFIIYTSASILTAFLGAAVLFGVMSFYGYFTKKDLTAISQFLFVGLIAVVVAGIINIFIGSTIFQMVISSIAILVFTGLTAYDTQRIRNELAQTECCNVEVSGALSLYLNLVNIFVSLLQLFGDKK